MRGGAEEDTLSRQSQDVNLELACGSSTSENGVGYTMMWEMDEVEWQEDSA